MTDQSARAGRQGVALDGRHSPAGAGARRPGDMEAYHPPMGRVTSPMFVGRAAELAALDAGLSAAVAGQATTILIEGEPGVGKSRLLQAWNERAMKRGARIAAGSCLDLGETGPAYTAIIEALRELIRDFGPGEKEVLAGPNRRVLARIVPELGTAADSEPPGSSLSTLGQTRMFERLVDVLRGAATTVPVVVELEDIHWADQSSQAFLLYLVEAARGASLLLLFTYRPEAAATSAAFRTTLGQLLRRQGVATMPLMPFDADELRQQLTGILGRPPSTALLNAIDRRSEGNPLFAEELAAAPDPSEGLPASVGAATAARLQALSANAQSVLRVASVVGRTATYDILREVTVLSDDDLANALREAVQVRLIEPIHDREAYRFRHALLQEAIYAETLPGERRRLHAAVAYALWDDPDRPPDDADLAPRLARHWLEAREYPRAFLASRAAATAAERQSAYAEAATHYERLLELWDRAGQATAGLTRAGALEHAAWMAFLAGERGAGGRPRAGCVGGARQDAGRAPPDPGTGPVVVDARPAGAGLRGPDAEPRRDRSRRAAVGRSAHDPDPPGEERRRRPASRSAGPGPGGNGHGGIGERGGHVRGCGNPRRRHPPDARPRCGAPSARARACARRSRGGRRDGRGRGP